MGEDIVKMTAVSPIDSNKCRRESPSPLNDIFYFQATTTQDVFNSPHDIINDDGACVYDVRGVSHDHGDHHHHSHPGNLDDHHCDRCRGK